MQALGEKELNGIPVSKKGRRSQEGTSINQKGEANQWITLSIVGWRGGHGEGHNRSERKKLGGKAERGAQNDGSGFKDKAALGVSEKSGKQTQTMRKARERAEAYSRVVPVRIGAKKLTGGVGLVGFIDGHAEKETY